MLPNLTLRQLETFREVMRSGSISAASRTLLRTQPAVSTMIANIEKELGFSLFQRERGRLKPSPEAHYLLEETEEVLERMGRTVRTMAEFGTLDRGHLRIACHPAASSYFMPRVLAAFLDTRPNVKADLMMRASHVVEDLIASQQFDIGLAETPSKRGSIKIEPFDPKCVIAISKSDPLADRDVITPADLDNYPMAMLFEGHTVTVATEKAFARSGKILNRRFVLRTFLPALELVSCNLCAAVVDRITASTSPVAGVVFREFKPTITSGIAILVPAHRPASVLTKVFNDHLREHLGQIERPIT
ncbi:LysR family transcriptional regulator [Pseudosulfitobacter pseudonitzschiae]|uniref:LysR family transcriptional regulator n=1 Tax=Pseudosulfitobacter pseudonitzschiae TaxID=1402135 RepID=UPI001AFBD8EA|nr:LysR substrate-binding domain-containing protein [Pseudosulfitobacter pseudonitzschiae]MBM1817965.1 LysR family transcriptional regulator [Pseudosulfitobacter pseudonitzschiae]MBM1835023.1 LysR family transcriptional regulator [Pseudosulfitobacter pseudonitzschiae]MBM1839824.1 LysR family transcriptional regulator [Pseudosulfitobacter pseudonitzschiae]MBM1844760.1 LysR family transcriptional regulator [Pseudosulfitobacter pseudonitzschiae]MBM1849563.1 LysR family transcriptional regulator [